MSITSAAEPIDRRRLFPQAGDGVRVGDRRIHEGLAAAFAAEGVDTVFALMGNGNMHWLYAMANSHGARNVHVRHEHSAVAAAEGYARATGKVGVAAISAGPAFTQVATALTVAARGRIPVVVLAGEAPMHVKFHSHRIDQAALTAPTGARYIQAHSVDRLLHDVREAFYCARVERTPVVIGLPEDLQKQPLPPDAIYKPAADLAPGAQIPTPDGRMIELAAEMIAAAERPIVLAGRGAVRANAGPALAALADSCGALLATTTLAKGLFDDHPFSIGVAGGYSNAVAREQFAKCDLVIAAGAALGQHTTQGGSLYPKARVLRIDTQLRGLWEAQKTGDLHVQGDAAVAARALLDWIRTQRAGFRSDALAQRIAAEPADPTPYPAQPLTVDPRDATIELDATIPKDWDLVIGSAHFTGFVVTQLKGRRPERYHMASDFGAIGQALPNAIGVAAARGDGKVALIDGDGSLMMHIQELDTIRRSGVRLLICVMNDGGFGAEAQKFRAMGLDPSEAMHGRGHLAQIARAFGLRGETVTSPGALAGLFHTHTRAGASELWDIHVNDAIPSPHYRRLHFGHA